MSYISRRALVAGSGALLLPKRARAVVMMPNTFNLAFPGGRAPGFDPNHVALSGGGVCRFSSVNLSGTVHTNLLTGTPPNSTVGTLSSKVFSNARYAVNTATTRENFTTGINLVSDNSFSLAAIIYITSTGVTQNVFAYGIIGTNGYGIVIGSTQHPGLAVAGSSNTPVANTLVANVPYLILIGASTSGTNHSHITLVLNLVTGQATNGSGVINLAETAPTQVSVGATTTGLIGGIAACAYISGGLGNSLAMLNAWAADPWSFWYPNRLQDLTQ